ncbi:MAG: hydantoinase B/oxoprolinase family protein [Acidimicrobiales bacterium]
MARWQFWIDRGGTFTDVVARRPDGSTATHKVLSHDPDRTEDAAVAGIRQALGIGPGETLPLDEIEAIRMGTTVATNALLERQGEPTVLVTTAGFGDALRIGHQARPDLFALDIVLPEVLVERVVEVPERVRADGSVERAVDLDAAAAGLEAALTAGIRSVAIVFVHGWRHHDHEAEVAQLAGRLGFAQVSVSHRVSPLMKFVPRGDTTVVDAYLSPVLRRYVDQVQAHLTAGRGDGGADGLGVPLSFMQSNGGLVAADRFQGKDALLSGPAGGVVGMVTTAARAGFDRVVGFDMGGTSTDVSHYAGGFERTEETEVAGVRVRAPMMEIHTIAAGGGSVVRFADGRLQVGPVSAGAHPGPAAYGRGGPMTVTDANVVLGRVRPDRFPAVFGPAGDGPLDGDAARRAAADVAGSMAETLGRSVTAEEVAEGALAVAVDAMANAIKRISVERGHDVADHALVSFGGAGGQHACAVADQLGIDTVVLHPHAGVLSALGIGVADVRVVRDEPVEAVLGASAVGSALGRAETAARAALDDQAVERGEWRSVEVERRVAVRYRGSDTSLWVTVEATGDDAGDGPADVDAEQLRARFTDQHRRRFGFASDLDLEVTSAQAEVIGRTSDLEDLLGANDPPQGGPARVVTLGSEPVWFDGAPLATPFVDRDLTTPGAVIDGPAVVVETTGTTVVPPGWQATVAPTDDLVVRRLVAAVSHESEPTVDPIRLEIFNNLFMNIAEQMGAVLQNTAVSVNIKERLDFSCAVFDPTGELVANAPHMPVHLGSMSESIRTVVRSRGASVAPGDAYVLNAPYNGGTHLPDITVVMPVFASLESPAGDAAVPLFYVAARGHHADVGGTVPGSAPADSTTVEEEGILFDDVLAMRDGELLVDDLRRRLTDGPHPARNPDQNLADLAAQLAACTKGADELRRVVDHYGAATVHRFMDAVRGNAADAVRRLLGRLPSGSATVKADDGSVIAVDVRVDAEARRAVIDFTGTSGVHPGNFNAPRAVTQAAVLYVLRCLVGEPIPLNGGCLDPVEVIVPSPSLLDPRPPAAVIAGNVETSQLVVEALFTALGVAAASQGTMNNVIWGNDRVQYYETLCGGAGATANAGGCSAVHTHMTNSRLTDVEVLEWRFPVMVEEFSIRRGSGGHGHHEGGDGVVRRVRFDEAVDANLITSRRVVAPAGMAGGGDGARGENRVVRADGSVEELAGVTAARLGPGDALEIRTPGGGGWGSVDDAC